METAFHIFITVYAALFPITNPLGGAPIFLSFVRGQPPQIREKMARKVAIYGFILLLGSMLFGAQILLFFGVSLPVLNVAGGLVVASLGWSLLHQDDDPDKKSETQALKSDDVLSQAFYPLTMPLTVGPGTIAVTIALAAGQSHLVNGPWYELAFVIGGALAGILALCLTVYFAYREAGTIERVLGRNGTTVLVRLFAFILLAIGLQILWGGVKQLAEQIS